MHRIAAIARLRPPRAASPAADRSFLRRFGGGATIGDGLDFAKISPNQSGGRTKSLPAIIRDDGFSILAGVPRAAMPLSAMDARAMMNESFH
jgi:hypothetical protein